MKRLLISSGQGPAECRLAVRHIAERIASESSNVDVTMQGDENARASAVVTLRGAEAEAIAARWLGTIQWTCKSPVRPKHKRQNWFVGVFALGDAERFEAPDPRDVRYETFRAGGPGGQHQNTTDSAVRATHVPTGLTATAREERSQHRNKAAALQRLGDQMAAREALSEAASKKDANRNHTQLERGNPVRRFKGEKFVEVG